MNETKRDVRSNAFWFICGLLIAIIGALLWSQSWSDTGFRPVDEKRVWTNFERVAPGDDDNAQIVTDSDASREAAGAIANSTIKLTDENFVDVVLSSSKPVLVDFWAAWCKPCSMLAPAIDEMAKSFGDTAMIGKLNVDENPLVAGALEVEALPTLLIFKDGKIVDQIIGAASPDHIAQRLHAAIDVDAS